MGLFDFLRRPRVQLPVPDLQSLAAARGRMSPFDMFTGRLCSEYYREGADTETTLYFGAFAAFLHAVRESLEGTLDPQALLASHAAGGAGADELVSVTGAWAADALDASWEAIVQVSAESASPIAGTLVEMVVNTTETLFPRPRGRLPLGHFAVIIDYVTAYALHIAQSSPAKAHLLMDDASRKRS